VRLFVPYKRKKRDSEAGTPSTPTVKKAKKSLGMARMFVINNQFV